MEESELDRRSLVTTFRIVPDAYAGLLRCAGTVTVRADDAGRAGDGEGSRRVTEADLEVTVPFVGGSVERAIVSGLRDHAVAEARVVNDWLAARRP